MLMVTLVEINFFKMAKVWQCWHGIFSKECYFYQIKVETKLCNAIYRQINHSNNLFREGRSKQNKHLMHNKCDANANYVDSSFIMGTFPFPFCLQTLSILRFSCCGFK